MSDRKPVIISEEQLEEQRQYIQQIRLMPDAPKSYHVVTYGCQMNAHDSEILAGMLRDMGMEEAADRESADFVLFNTCCVRDNAERRALGNVTWLKEVRKKNPRLMIGVCGCMIQQPLCGFGVWHGEPVPPAGTDAQSAGKRPSGGGGGGAEHDCRGSARAAPAP